MEKKFITHRKKISMDNEQNNSVWTFGFAKKFFFFSQVRRYNAREKFGRVARFSSSEC